MSVKAPGSARRRSTDKTTEDQPLEIVVRRGALRRFDELKAKTAELPVVLTWDRREDERRKPALSRDAGDGRRDSDRRRKPPFTWDVADFVVVQRASRAKGRKKTSGR